MDVKCTPRWHVWLLLLALVLAPRCAVAQGATATSSLRIVVRDAEAHRLPGMTVKVFQERPAGPARQVAELMTDATGTLTVERLDAEGAYVVQFHSAARIIVDGQRASFLPMQFVDDQGGREDHELTQLPGFAIQLRGQTAFTQRFVVGGTYADAPLVAAVPMFDMAERDDAPPRPIHPLTGQELTPAEARLLAAPIGQPWRITPTREQSVSEGELAEAHAASAVAVEPVELEPAAPDAAATMTAPWRWRPLLVLAASVGLLSVVLLVFGRRSGGQPR